jgi:hypothetical protein
MPIIFYKLEIIGVIVLLIIGSLFLNYSIFTEKYKKESSYIIILFIAFTIAATLLFHLPTDKTQQIQFFKNVSIIVGFILLRNQHLLNYIVYYLYNNLIYYKYNLKDFLHYHKFFQ